MSGPPRSPDIPRLFLVLPSLGFASLSRLVYPPASSCLFLRPGICQKRAFPPVPWGGSLGVLPETSFLGWRAFIQDLPGSSSGASSPSFSVFCIPATWPRFFLHLFRRFLSCHLSGGAFLVKPPITLGLGSFLSLLVLGTGFPVFLRSR